MNTNALTTKEFITKAQKVHGNLYDYSNVKYVNAMEKVNIICKDHGLFFQSPKGHSDGSGCPKCGKIKNIKSKTLTQEEFIQRCKEIHGDLYDYSKSIYKNYIEKVEIICKEHGSFWQAPNSHLSQKSGCHKCGTIRKRQNQPMTTQEFIIKAKSTCGNLYDYSKTNYITTRKNIEIICKKHGSFWQTPDSHLSNRGCPKCKASHGECEIIKWLIDKNIEFTHQKRFIECRDKIPLSFDFWVPSKNTLIEFDGEQHYKCGGYLGKHKMTQSDFSRIKHTDAIKTKYAEDNGYKLLRIPHWEFKNIPIILSKWLL
jgi:hypothetical protein